MASLILSVIILLTLFSFGDSQLSAGFYGETCPGALDTIAVTIGAALKKEPRMGASLIRLHFHDCFVQGCDASILLNDSASIVSEKNAAANNNSARGFQVIDEAKAKLESLCPGIVSCADIVAVAARDSSVALGGPTWTVKLGRRDSTTASMALADSQIPNFKDSLARLIARFDAKGLSERDLVALSGAHTIGQAHCPKFHDRIYSNDSDIDAAFAANLRRTCPSKTGSGDADILAPLDNVSPNKFDNIYYTNLKEKKGLLESDQILDQKDTTKNLIELYRTSQDNFKADFAAAMVKMGDIDPLTGSAGEVRRFCAIVNNNTRNEL